MSLALSIAMSASTTWNFQSLNFNVDTVYHAKVGPGTTTTSLELTGSQRLDVFYTTIDVTNPNVDIRVVKASNGAGNQTLSTMQSNASREGAQYFIGTNADFFAGTTPCGSTIVDGEMYNVVNSGFDNFWMADDGVPRIGAINFSGTVTAPNGSHALHGINTYRNENQLIIYQRYAFNSITVAPTNAYGAEVQVELVEGELAIEGTVKYRVISEVNTAGGSEMPVNGAVLAGHGTGKTFIQGLKIGDELVVKTSSACELGGKVMQMASGCPMILKDGQVLDTETALDHLVANNPRTAVGYNADRTKVILLVVDGRGTSVGCVSKTLAGIMQQLGCADAMNFDGGGSSCLYSKDLGVRNNPSDGRERAVVNSVWAVATSPSDETITEIAFETPVITLPRYGYYTPRIYGYNKYGVLVDTDVKGYTLSCDESLGVPMSDGSVLFANGSGTHALTASYNGVTATIPVTIGTAAPRMRLSNLLLDNTRTYTAEVVADVNGTDMPLSNVALSWSTSDADIATVDDAGVIEGHNEGTATVSGTVADVSVNIPVKVEIASKRYLPIVPNDLSTWKIAGSGTKDRVFERDASGDLLVSYTVSNTRSTYVTIKPAELMALYSLPDSIRMLINPGDATITKLRLQLGAPGERASDAYYEVALTPSANNVFEVPISDFVNVNDFVSYPVNLTAIHFILGDANATTHTIKLSALDAVYTKIDADQGVDKLYADESIVKLLTKSCVELGSDVHLNVDAPWMVYALDGTMVLQGNGSVIPTTGLSGGLYVVSATSGLRTLSEKLLLR